MRQDDVVKRLDFKPGDIAVLTVPNHLAVADAARVRKQLEDALPGCKVLILDGGVQLTIVAQETLHGNRAKES